MWSFLNLTEFADALETSFPLLLSGFGTTIEAALYSIALGTIVGVLLGLALVYGGRTARFLIRMYVDIARGIPGLVAIFTVYYFVNQAYAGLMGYQLSALTCGVIALAVHGSAQIAEMTRGAIQSLSRGQTEAGKAIGLTFVQIQLYIIFPQAVRQILPTWVTSAGEVVKGTTLLSLISVPELFVATKESASREYMYFEFYVFSMIVYFLVIYGIEIFGRRLEAKFAKY